MIREDDLLELVERSERLAALEDVLDRLCDGQPITEVFPEEMLYDGEIRALTQGLRKAAMIR